MRALENTILICTLPGNEVDRGDDRSSREMGMRREGVRAEAPQEAG